MVYGKVHRDEGPETSELAIGQAGARAQVWLLIFTLSYCGDLDVPLPTWILPSASDLLQYQCREWKFGACFVLFFSTVIKLLGR